MISYSNALELIAAACSRLETDRVPLENMLGRSPTDDLRSSMNVPSIANSAMDGFALRAADTTRASTDTPVEIPVTGLIAAGQKPIEGIAGQSVEIMTGAPLPTGYDTVVPVERIEAQRATDGTAILIRCKDPVEPDRNVRHAGQDFQVDQKIFNRGHECLPHHIMGLAATGTDVVRAYRKPRIALITTGNELATSGIPTNRGLIRDANGPYLRSFLAQLSLEITQADSVTDDPRDLGRAIDKGSLKADIVLTTGGVSAGRFDLIPDTIESLGGETIFHKVAIRPGKPLLFGRLRNGSLFFGLPGNPIAVAVGLRFFVLPALFHLQGLKPERFLPTTCTEPVTSKENLTFFGKARTEIDGESRLITRLLQGQESFKINSLMQANSWAIVPEGTKKIDAGEHIEIAPLYPGGFLQ